MRRASGEGKKEGESLDSALKSDSPSSFNNEESPRKILLSL
jgi:hypothetical protein